MLKRVLRNVMQKIASGVSSLSPQDHSQFFFISLLSVVAIITIGFYPLFGVNGLFIKSLVLPIFAGVLLIIVAIQSLKNGHFTLLDKKTSWVLLAFLLAMLISSIFAFAPRNALFGTLGETPSFALIFSLVIIFYIAAASLKKFSQVLGLLFVTACVYTITFLHVLLRVIFGAKILTFGFLGTLTGSLAGSWTDFALFSLLMVIMAVICLEMGKFVRAAKWVTVAVGVMGIIGMFLTNISWVWILAGAILIITSIYIFSLAFWNSERSSYDKGRPLPWYSVGTFILVLVGFLFGAVIVSPITKHRPLSYTEVYPNAGATMQATWQSIKERPITGVGLSSFNHAWNKIKPVALSGTNTGSIDFPNGYSFITTLIATTGILGILAIIAFLWMIARLYRRIFKHGFNDPSQRFAGMLVIAGSVMLTLITILDYPGISILVLWMAFLGALWSMAHDGDDERQVSFVHDPRTSFFGILAVLVLVFVGGAFIYITVRQTTSVFSYGHALKAYANNDEVGGSTRLINANQLWSTDFYNRTLANQALRQVQSINPDNNLSKDALTQEVQRVLSVGMSFAETSTKLDPKNYQNWITLGNVYEFFTSLKVDGAGDRAKTAYQTAKDLSPNDRTLDLLMASLSETQGDSAGAKDIVMGSINAFPTPNAYIWLYQRDIAAKDYSDAETHLIAALNRDSNNSGILTELGTLYFVRGKYTDAAVAFERSLSLNRNQPTAFAFLGVAYESSGKTEQANQVFDFLRKQIPDTADKLITQVRAQKGGAVTPTVDTTETSTTSTKAGTKTTTSGKTN